MMCQVFRLFISMTLFVNVSMLSARAFGQGEAPDENDYACCVIEQKSCAEMFGAFPSPNKHCIEVNCFSEDYCTNGEALVLYPTHGVTETEWTTFKYDIVKPSDETLGRKYTLGSSFCYYQTVCMYECAFRPGVAGGFKCQPMYISAVIFFTAGNDQGPCPPPLVP